MGVYKWICRKGSAGQTARVIARQFLEFKERMPQASDDEIYQQIVELRKVASELSFPYTSSMLSQLELILLCPEVTVAQLAVAIVLIEAKTSLTDIGLKRFKDLIEVIQEEIYKCGITSQKDDSADLEWGLYLDVIMSKGK